MSIRRADEIAEASYEVHVRSENLAPVAIRVLHQEAADGLDVIRDRRLTEPVFYSSTREEPHRQWYGYEWPEAVEATRLGLYVGFPREEWGWLVNPIVEYADSAGVWQRVRDVVIEPPFPEGRSKYLQPGFVAYDVRFAPVITTAIRIAGTAGGDPVDGAPIYGTAVSELTVHAR